MLQVSGVSKSYRGGIAALSDINLTADRGVYGLLGPNGAGKSTLMRTIATLQPPDCGEIRLHGTDLFSDTRASRHRIGYLPQDMGVYPRVSAREMLDYLAGLRGIDRRNRRSKVSTLLERVNLAEVADRSLDTYSGGMRRRFGIATAFLGNPELVIVDEPTAGLDPTERRRFQLLLAEAAQNCVLILSSHIVEDLAGLCSDLALIRKGRIVETGAPAGLISQLEDRIWERRVRFDELERTQSQFDLLSWRPDRGGMTVRVLADTTPGEEFVPSSPDLEDLYSVHIAGSHQ